MNKTTRNRKMKNIFTLRGSSKPWSTRRKPQPRSPFLFISIFLFSIILFFIAYTHIPKSLISLPSTPNTRIREFTPCRSAKILNPRQRFLFYAPHSGFSNQLQEFKNAILMAGILNRTLIIPPVLDHHAVALGSCPKFRVSSPTEIRMSVWNHTIELLRSGR